MDMRLKAKGYSRILKTTVTSDELSSRQPVVEYIYIKKCDGFYKVLLSLKCSQKPEQRSLSKQEKKKKSQTGKFSVLVISICMPLVQSPFRFHFLPYLANFKSSRQNEKGLSFQRYNRKRPFLNGKMNPRSTSRTLVLTYSVP